MSKADHARRAGRGRKAAQEFEELAAAFEAVECAILQGLRISKVGQDTKILNLHRSLQNLDAVRKAMLATVRGGIDAAAIMDALEEAELGDAED